MDRRIFYATTPLVIGDWPDRPAKTQIRYLNERCYCIDIGSEDECPQIPVGNIRLHEYGEKDETPRPS